MNPFEIELIYAGRSLKDDLKMEQYGLKPGCTVHVLVKKYREPSMLAEPSHSGGNCLRYRLCLQTRVASNVWSFIKTRTDGLTMRLLLLHCAENSDA